MRRSLSLLVATLVACASSPQAQEDELNALVNGPECHVWVDGGMGSVKATVRRGVAEIGGYQLAYFQRPGAIAVGGLFGTSDVAVLQGRDLTIQPILGSDKKVVIGDRVTHMDGAFADLTFYHNPRCAIPDAALGIVSILVVASQHH